MIYMFKLNIHVNHHTVHLFLFTQIQVLIQVPQKNSVITWDFDVLKGDVTFTIYRSREHMSTPRHEHHVPGAVGGIGSQQYISKRMSVGVDLVTCCQPCICRDGDSIQV